MIGAGQGEDAELVVAEVGNRLQRAGRLVGRGRRRRSRELDRDRIEDKIAELDIGDPFLGCGVAGRGVARSVEEDLALVRQLDARDAKTSTAERSVGRECVSTVRSRWSPYH